MEDFSARPPVKRFINDLESVVTARHPVVRQHLEWLRERAAHARMTGSGACVFAEFERREDAEAVMRELPGTMQGFVAQGLREHPLREL
jgi:4-diphosphocytidyl-2-C-methyl-D-erythritol kinase